MSTSSSSKSDSWFKVRNYIHLDKPTSKKKVLDHVKSPQNIAKHSFLPFIKYIKYIPRYKPDLKKTIDKERPILYASHMDAHAYAFYARNLSVSYEEYIQDKTWKNCITAYRALGRSNVDFAKEVFDEIRTRTESTALAFDLSSFFDNIDHQILKESWCKVLGGYEYLPIDHYKIFKSITQYSYINREEILREFGISDIRKIKNKTRICTPEDFRMRVRNNGLIFKNEKPYGIPQGSPISAVLSNIFLVDFDEAMAAKAFEINGFYRRYCDDILWVCPPQHAEDIIVFVRQEIAKYGEHLTPNDDKTERSEFYTTGKGVLASNKPLQYLGFTFDGQKCLLRSHTISRYYRRLKRSIREAGQDAAKNGGDKIYKRDIYEKFSHLGKRSFVRYSLRSSEKMGSLEIRRQVRRHWEKIQSEIQLIEARLPESNSED